MHCRHRGAAIPYSHDRMGQTKPRLFILRGAPHDGMLARFLRTELAPDLDLCFIENMDDARSACPPIVAYATESLDQPGLARELSLAVAAGRPWISVIVLTRWDLAGIRRLLGTGVDDAFCLPTDHDRLLRLVDESQRDHFDMALLGCAERCAINGVVTAALARLGAAVYPRNPPPPRSMRELAQLVGCSTGHLRACARSAGVDLSLARKLSVLARGFKERSTKRRSWGRIALDLGYEGPAGLSNLSFRLLGKTLGQVEAESGRDIALALRAACSGVAPVNIRRGSVCDVDEAIGD